MPASESRFRKSFPASWAELHRDAKALAWRLAEAGPWRGIVGVSRGGLVPATIVARELDLRVVDTVCIQSYRDQEQGALKVLKATGPEVAAVQGEGWLVVDDLVDTGTTYRAVRQLLPAAHFATVYAKPSGRPLVDTFITEVSQDTWIIFPWDSEPPLRAETAFAG